MSHPVEIFRQGTVSPSRHPFSHLILRRALNTSVQIAGTFGFEGLGK